MADVLTVNLARVRPNPDATSRPTGIDKAPAPWAVEVRAPGPMTGGLGSGLVGDFIGNRRSHGGDDQAVYAYAREDLDAWETQLGRALANGAFGENLTTSGIDVCEARIGERGAPAHAAKRRGAHRAAYHTGRYGPGDMCGAT